MEKVWYYMKSDRQKYGPYTDGEIISRIHSEGVNISEEYEEAGTHISAVVPAPLAGYINSKYTPSESL